MLTRRDVQRNLLQKFDELCKKADAKYVLHGHVAFLAYFNKPIGQVNSLEVLMCQGDAERVSKILDDDAYYFEDAKSNLKFDMPYMMFGLRDSIDLKNKDTDFNATRNIENHCIRILINYIEKPVNEITKKILKSNRKVLKFRYMDDDYNFRNYKSKRNVANKVFKVINDSHYNKLVYSFKKRTVSINTWEDIKKYPFIKTAGKMPAKSTMFNSIVPVDIDGVSSFIIEDFKAYASHFYGNDWKNKKWPQLNNCTSNLVGWEEFSSNPEVKKRLHNIQKNYDIIHTRYARTIPDRDVIKEMKKQIRQSKSVIYTREEIIQQKDKIIELYQTENLKELEVILNPLIRSLRNGINRGYTYSVDDDIDSILDSYLRKTNNSELADDIKKYRTEV